MRHVIVAVFFCGAVGQAQAKPVVERDERVEIDWSNMKIRFFGEAQADGGAKETLKGAEQRAWQEGIAYISTYLGKLREERSGLPDPGQMEVDKQAPQRVSSSTYSVNTTYFANGRVRVHLENALPRAFHPGFVAFKSLTGEPVRAKNSGIVLRVSSKVRPTAIYRVITDQGQAVFEARDVAKESFERNFMGAWFENPSSQELERVVGKNPIYLDAQVGTAGTFRVNQGQWTAGLSGNEALLRAARVAISLK